MSLCTRIDSTFNLIAIKILYCYPYKCFRVNVLLYLKDPELQFSHAVQVNVRMRALKLKCHQKTLNSTVYNHEK